MVAYAFHLPVILDVAHRTFIQAVGIAVEHTAHLPQLPLQPGPVGRRQLADGMDSQPFQLLLDILPHIEKGGGGQGPDDLMKIFPGDLGGGIRFAVIAAQLGKNLIEAHPHRDGEPQFLPDTGPQLVGNLAACPKQLAAPGDIQPAFVDAKRLHQIGVLGVDGVDQAGIFHIFATVSGGQHQPGAFALGLPDGLRRLDAILLRQLVFRQDHPMAALRIPAHRHGHIFQLRAQQALHRGIKGVAVTVQNHPIHPATSDRNVCSFSIPQKSRHATNTNPFR